MNMYEFSRQIQKLKKENRWNEAIDFFKKNKSDYREEDIGKNKFIVSDMIGCLRKIDKSKTVNTFLKKYHVIINESTDELILNAYGWATYDNIKQKTINKQDIVKHISYLIYLLSFKHSQYSYSVISNIFTAGLKIAKETQNQDYIFTDTFCNIFDVNILTLQSKTIDVDGKNREQASDKEKWYSEKTKALFHLERYQECLEISQEALKSIDKFHNNSNIWFTRYTALSQKEQGNHDVAIEILQKIFKTKNEWFIQKEIAELYYDKGDSTLALKYGIEALKARGEMKFKINLILLVAEILKNNNEISLAKKHFLLVKKIREKYGWEISEELDKESADNDPKNISYNDLKNELSKYWESLSMPKQKIYQGVIKKILHDNEKGKVGFIVSEEKDYYFNIHPSLKINGDVSENSKVKFKVLNASDTSDKAKILEVIN